MKTNILIYHCMKIFLFTVKHKTNLEVTQLEMNNVAFALLVKVTPCTKSFIACSYICTIHVYIYIHFVFYSCNVFFFTFIFISVQFSENNIDLHKKCIASSISSRGCLWDWMGVFGDRSIDLKSQHSYLEVLAVIGRLNFILIIPLGDAVCI